MSLLVLIRWCVVMQSRVCVCVFVVYVAMHMWLYVDGWSFPTGFSLPVPSSASLHTFILQLRTATDSARLFPVCIFMAASVGVEKKKYPLNPPKMSVIIHLFWCPCALIPLLYFCTVRNNHPFGRHFTFILCFFFFFSPTGVVTSNLIFFCFKLKISFCYTWHCNEFYSRPPWSCCKICVEATASVFFVLWPFQIIHFQRWSWRSRLHFF